MIPIPGFPDYATNDGKIYSNKIKRILTGSFTTPGYLHVQLRINGQKCMKLIHRLICLAFHPNPHNKPQVNHKDGDKLNNHPDNLEWATKKENSQHAWRTGLHENTRKAFRNNHKTHGKAIISIGAAGNIITEYPSIAAAARTIQRNKDTLRDALNGKQKKCAGLKWQYKKLEKDVELQ